MWAKGRTRAGLAVLGTALFLAIAPSADAALTLTLSSDRDLSSPATIEVSGTGWTALAPVFIRQCTGENVVSPGDCTADPLAAPSADAAGNFGPVAVTVTRTFTGNVTGNTVDCLATVCVLWGSSGGGANKAQKTIAFAPPASSTAPPGTSPAPPEAEKKASRRAAIKRCKKRFEKGDPKRQRCLAKARKLPT
jgi:hypothetical protein